MKIPKYIDLTLKRRTAGAEQYLKYDAIITEYIEKHYLDVDECHYQTGCESICLPRSSEKVIRKAIEDKE